MVVNQQKYLIHSWKHTTELMSERLTHAACALRLQVHVCTGSKLLSASCDCCAADMEAELLQPNQQNKQN